MSRNSVLALVTLLAIGGILWGKATRTQEAAATAAAQAPASAAEEAPDFGLLNAHRPEEGVLFGGQPSAEQLREIVAAGYRILDLRTAGEDRGFDEPGLARELGGEYTNLEVNGDALARDETYQRFFEAFEQERPVLVHCASGNRVGGLYYAYLVRKKGWSGERALAAAKANGLRSEALAEAITRWLEGSSGG